MWINNDLRSAASDGNLDAVRKFLADGANVHENNDFALRIASRFGHDKVVKLLLENGANVHADGYQIDDGQALQVASREGHYEVIKVLLKHGADVHANYDQALFVAYRYNRHEIANLLIAQDLIGFLNSESFHTRTIPIINALVEKFNILHISQHVPREIVYDMLESAGYKRKDILEFCGYNKWPR